MSAGPGRPERAKLFSGGSDGTKCRAWGQP